LPHPVYFIRAAIKNNAFTLTYK